MTLLSKFDPSNYFLVLRDYPQHFVSGLQLAKNFKINGGDDISRIILCGMGGSALPGDFVNDYLDSEVSIEINRDYNLPSFLDTKTLIIAVSYSGNTEETLSAFDEALKRHCKVVAITSGGELLKQAKMLDVPYVQMPQGFQPRQVLGYMFSVIISLLQNSGIIPDKTDEIMRLAEELDEVEYEEKAKMFADVLMDKVPIIYTTTKYKSIARFWKICFNENTKIQSFYNIIPEANHNEMVGFSHLLMKPHIIFLESLYNVSRNTKRIQVMKELFSKHNIPTSEFMMHGRDTLTQLFTTVLFGYWVSYFLAIMYETDPTPVAWVEDFKKSMQKE